MKVQRRMVALLAVGIWLSLSACRDETPGPSGPPSPNTDREIAGILNAANEGEVMLGELARNQAVNGDVKNFAQDMVDEHHDAQVRQNTLFSNLGLLPIESSTSQGLRNDADATHNMLKPLSGSAFDRGYIDSQVKMHAEVLSMLDSQLLVKVQNQQLREDLQRMRQDVAKHLGRAQQLQGQLP